MKPRQLLPTLLCLFGLAGPGQAQTDSTQAAPSPVHIDKRIELEINARRGSNYRVMPLGPTGMLLFFENEEPLRSFKKEVIIGKYSPDLNLQWAQTFALETTSNLNIYAMQGDWLYFLVPKLEKNYEILRLNVRSGAFSLVKYPKILDMDVTQFAVLNEVFYLGGMVNGNPVVVHYNHQAGKPKVLPGINQLKATLNRLDVDAPSGRLSVMLTSNQRRKAAFYYLLYDNEGKAISNYTAPYEKEYTLFTFRPHYLNAQEQLIYGLYSLSAKDKAQGVYVAKLKNNEQESLKFYDFGYFKNFFNYLVPRRKERLLSRLRDRRDEGKIYKHDYNFFMRDLQFVGDKTILVAESYTPIFTEGTPGLRPYTTGLWGAAPWALTPSAFAFNNPALDPFGRPSNRTPVGYRFKHAFVCAFDASGKLLWDNGYEFKDLESTQPDQFVQVATDGNGLKMMHFQEDKLYFKQTTQSLPVDSLHTVQLYPKNEEKEQVIEREREQVSYWYGDYFLLYGVQELKNPPAALWASGGPVPVLGGGTPETKNRPLSDNDRPASRSRKVFYLTKLKIMPQE